MLKFTSMARNLKIRERRTGVDTVFDYLYDEITSMRLRPGTKISEAEIAGLFGISRQPVRDAFGRLENRDLLLIRPQKATEVKRFSSAAITTARFVRAAVEAEVLRCAARRCTKDGRELLQSRLAEQESAVKENSYDRFRSLDYEFHQTICTVAETEFALEQLLDDHSQIAQLISANDEDGAAKAGMLHLSRLDATIDAIREEHADFFDD